MKTIAKVAIGCGIAALVAGIVAIVALGGAAWWLKGKAESFAGDEAKIEALQKTADGNPFTAPADGVLREDRLVKFLDVRKRVFAVYEKHRGEIEAMGEKKQADLSDVGKAFGMLGELRLALAQAQADVGMSRKEYEYLVEQVYKTMWASEIAKSTGGETASEATAEAARQAQEALEQAKEQAGGTEAEDKVAEAIQESAEAMAKAVDEAKALDVPKANIELFRKHEADIKKYAMGGLELLGL